MSDSWLWMTAAELGRGIEAGAIDPRELTEVYLAAIDSHPDAPGIYARTTPERARAEADAAAARAARRAAPRPARRRAGQLEGPLRHRRRRHRGAARRCSRGRVPERDAAVLAAATRAGLVCLGKTHLTELAFSGLGINPVTATPPNINDPELAPGGSSSGAAAVGRLRPGGGGDRLGHRRLGAGPRRLERPRRAQDHARRCCRSTACVPLCPRFDTVGPLCRSVEDAALLLAALGGPRRRPRRRRRSRGARLLVLEDPRALPTRDAPQAAFEAALARLAAAGARHRPRPGRRRRRRRSRSAPTVAGGRGLRRLARRRSRRNPERDVRADPRPLPRRRRASPPPTTSPRLRAARRAARRLARGDRRLRRGAAADRPPTCRPNVERLLADPGLFAAENLLALRNPTLANLLGLCALTLPTGVPCCGLMLMAPRRRRRPAAAPRPRRRSGRSASGRKMLDPRGTCDG